MRRKAKKERPEGVLFSDSFVGWKNLFSRVNADLLLSASDMLELHSSVDQSEQRVVLAETDIVAGTDRRASLADNDVARENCLTVRLLDTETLCVTVSAVLGRTDALLMSEELKTDS